MYVDTTPFFSSNGQGGTNKLCCDVTNDVKKMDSCQYTQEMDCERDQGEPHVL